MRGGVQDWPPLIIERNDSARPGADDRGAQKGWRRPEDGNQLLTMIEGGSLPYVIEAVWQDLQAAAA